MKIDKRSQNDAKTDQVLTTRSGNRFQLYDAELIALSTPRERLQKTFPRPDMWNDITALIGEQSASDY